MWNPEFDFVERVPARISGYARSFCMWSIHHRGTPEVPGLVLALDEQKASSCRGLAFHVGPQNAAQTLKDLRARELVSSAYVEREVMLQLDDGRNLSSLAYVIDPKHEQYTGQLTLEKQAEIIARAHGGRGANSEYLYNTAEHLQQIGMEDHDLTQLAAMVKELLKAKERTNP